MTLSDALPVQFWNIDDETYNEQSAAVESSGINPFCFCQDWELNDTILLQFTDTSGYNFYLVAISEDGTVASSMPDIFTKAGTLYTMTVDLATIGLSAGKFYFLILRSPLTTYTLGAPSTWSDLIDPDTFFDSKSATQFVGTGMATRNLVAYKAYAPPAGLRIRISYTVTITGSFSGTLSVLFGLAAVVEPDGGSNIGEYDTNDFQSEFTVAGVYSVTQVIDAPLTGTVTYLQIKVDGTGITSGNPNIAVTITPANVLSYGNIQMKSDCLNLYEADSDDTNAGNTNLEIYYSNDTNVFGIDYETGSPSAQFTIRIPARFFHESFPQEQEEHELSSDEFITLWSKLERKKLLEIGYVPYFMHKKIQMILMHDNIAINGEMWLKRDPYQLGEGDKNFSVKQATVLLTDKDTIERNLI